MLDKLIVRPLGPCNNGAEACASEKGCALPFLLQRWCGRLELTRLASHLVRRRRTGPRSTLTMAMRHNDASVSDDDMFNFQIRKIQEDGKDEIE